MRLRSRPTDVCGVDRITSPSPVYNYVGHFAQCFSVNNRWTCLMSHVRWCPIDLTPMIAPNSKSNKSCRWVGFTRRLGWVGNWSEISVFGGLGRVTDPKWQVCENYKSCRPLYMQLCIEYRQANSYCSSVHYSYGRSIVVRHYGGSVGYGMGWILGLQVSPGNGLVWAGSMNIDPRTTPSLI